MENEKPKIAKLSEREQKSLRFNFALEPAYFVLYFGFNLTCAVKQNQMLKQSCLLKGYNMTECMNLSTDNVNKSLEEALQPEIATINMSMLLLNSIFPGLFSLILGSWSDLYGRKKILVLSFSGYAMTLGLIANFSFWSDNVSTLTSWVYFIAEMPMTFLGGWPALDIGVTCYVADLSNDENRSFRLGIIGFLNFFGNALAYMSSSYILAATNITVVHMSGFTCSLFALIWVFFFVDESVEIQEKVSSAVQFKEIFSLDRFKEIFDSLCKKRPLKCHQILWLLISIPTLILFTMHGNGTLNYLFVRQQFAWSIRDWTIYESINNVISVIGMFIGIMILKKCLQISDMKLGILGLLSYIVEAFIKTFANKGYQLYISSAVSIFRLLSFPMFRSMASLVVPHQEVGKVYSLMTCFGALSGLGAAPLYTAVYNETFTYFPGAFNLITASAIFVSLIFTGYIAWWNFVMAQINTAESFPKLNT